MNLKKCTCGIILTTKNCEIERNVLGLWLTCKKCGSTALLKSKDSTKYINNMKDGQLCLAII